jgi:hypothetical protein
MVAEPLPTICRRTTTYGRQGARWVASNTASPDTSRLGRNGPLPWSLFATFLGNLPYGDEEAMPKPYVLHLNEHRCGQLYALIQKGHASARAIHRAHMLRLAHARRPVQTIVAMLHTSPVTVTRRASGFCTRGWRPRCMISPGREAAANCMRAKRPIWCCPPVVRSPPDRTTGACGYWPIAWSS